MLYIIKELSLDKANRIILTRYFEGKIPKTVGIGYDPIKKELIVQPYDESSGLTQYKVDDKNRISIPKWITQKCGRDFYIVADDTGKRSIIPITNSDAF